ncbi:hypothetical protein A9P82_11225 [Arachidicoccus ginsenosidimutans]|uniref:alpha/beta hydrolase n=1 Tax=Arachidicoccus sp. BS20 TaxID=1850526 RepID=UPI0007F0B861|nr:alpha/beta hydrolase [Arachidicoccus sp. BS20]ANI89809.1 hypothetical protein A9P82_11225 [Arachidicoccus sp. BS20]
MKNFFKILGIIGLVILVFYLISIPIIRDKNPIKEIVFFTPTKYDKTRIFNQLDSSFLANISKDSILFAANKFIDSRNSDSLFLNHTKIKRDFKKLTNKSNSEFYTIAPNSYEKVGIFMLGNTFNVFNVFDQLTELSQNAKMKIYVITYNGNGYSEGQSSFKDQFNVNKKFYDYINSNEKVDYVFGHSLGTVFATKLAVDYKTPNLILLSPASNLDDMISYFKGLTNIFARPYFNTSELETLGIDKLADNSEKVKNYHGNLLLIHGTNDTNLPYSMSEKILNNCPSNSKRLITVKDGDHYTAFKKENWNRLMADLK